jgi:dTDP-glucose pyrophosphorylase
VYVLFNKILTIVIPMAGLGRRFAEAGFSLPKPLVSVNGKPMIGVVIDNLRPKLAHRFVFICQTSHVKLYELDKTLLSFAPGANIVEIDEITDGAVCTVLKAERLIGDGPLMIANCDQFIDHSIDSYLLHTGDLDGLIMTMSASDPKWSFVALDDDGLVSRVAEKVAISSIATVGIYYFARGADFIWAAESMLEAGARVNGEFYLAPVYNFLIARGARIGSYCIGSDGRGMHGLGIPTDLSRFLALPLASRV